MMPSNFYVLSWTLLILLYLHFVSCSCIIDNVSNKSECPLWHFLRNGVCHCGGSGHGIFNCDKRFVYIKQGSCMTWNNVTSSAEVYRCLFTKWSNYSYSVHGVYQISTTAFGEKLNHLTCGNHNRQGRYCRECIDGYGPALFSDDASCTDCSKHRHIWILNLVFQLFMVTVLCLLLMLFQIRGTSSPLNIIITYAQLISMGLKLDGNLHAQLVCNIGKTFTSIIIISLGVFNLDFFHLVIPPLCISPLFKSINILLFDYVIACYPLFLTTFTYLCIEVCDRQYLSFLRCPLKNRFKKFHTSWNPKTNILNTFATFLLLSYSKLLFTSMHLLLAFQSYNKCGERVSTSALLLYDPTVRFFHSEHIPYATLALLVMLSIIILPPLLLLVYPTSIFKKCLTCLRFRRWDILHHVMDIFQGWFKDGTEGTRDYRSLSALYLLFRVAVCFEFIFRILNDSYLSGQVLLLGIFNLLFGVIFFILQPYKQKWMNHFDGWTLSLVGSMILLVSTYDKSVYILGGVTGLSTMALLLSYVACQKCRNAENML